MKTKHLSVAIFPLNMGGSNAARLELEAIFVPPYNAARYGISMTTSPKQADIIMLMGSGTAKAADHVVRFLANLPDDVKLIMLGSETTSAQPFAEAYSTVGPILPADASPDSDLKLPPGKTITAYVAGSPPDPRSIIEAILEVSKKK